MISTKQKSYIDIAISEAAKSTYRFRLGAVIIQNGRVLGKGFSQYRNSPINVSDAHVKMCSVHAEADALRDAIGYFQQWPLKKATIYVARLNKANLLVLAKPCDRCTSLLLANGVKCMIWTIDENQYGVSKVKKI